MTQATATAATADKEFYRLPPHFFRTSTTLSLLFGYIGYYLCRNNLPAALPLLGAQFSLSNGQLAQIAICSELVYALGKFINGPLTDKFGGKKFFILGMVGTIIFNILFAYSSQLAFFILLWSACRFFLSMGWGALAALASQWHSPQRYGIVMGFLGLSIHMGGIVSTLFAGFLVATGHTWQQLFLYPAGILSIIMLACLFLIREAPTTTDAKEDLLSPRPLPAGEQSKKEIWPALKMLLSHRPFRGLLVYSFLVTFLRSVFLTWIPKMLVDLGQGHAQAIFQSSAFPILGSLSTILLGVACDRHSANFQNNDQGKFQARLMAIMLLGLFFTLLAMVSIIKWHSNFTPYLGVMVGLCGLFLLGPYTAASGLLSLKIGQSSFSGSCTGLVDGVGYLGGVLALLLTGIGADIVGWSGVLLMLAAFSLLAIGSALKLDLPNDCNIA